VQHRVGRAANGPVDADRILECRTRQDLRNAHVVLHERHDAAAGQVRLRIPA
jgi:hypothetical protein